MRYNLILNILGMMAKYIGVLFLMIGFILLNIKTGSIWFFDYSGQVTPAIYALLFIGFGIKADATIRWMPTARTFPSLQSLTREYPRFFM